MHSLVFGAVAGVVCYFAIQLKFKFGYDDSLDVVGIHFAGGVTGGVLLGLFADASSISGGDFKEGLFFGGGVGLLGNQVLSIVVVAVFSFVVTYGIAKVLDATIGLRVSKQSELEGLDQSEHAERAYHFGDSGRDRIG